MIDFSNYTEKVPFIIPTTSHNAFLVEAFQEKNSRYIYELKEFDRTVYRYFDSIEPDWVLNVARKADKVFFFFKEFSSFAQKAKMFQTFEGEFTPTLAEAWLVLEQIFYKIGTTYQLFGYFDTHINAYISGSVIRQQFLNLIQQGVHDLNLLLDPLIDLMYLFEVGSSLQASSWSPILHDITLDNLIQDYARVIVSSDVDDRYESIGTSLQVSYGLFENNLTQSGNNVEMIMSKTLKISMDSYDLKQKLINVRNSFVLPNY